jgi:hypothetical protein
VLGEIEQVTERTISLEEELNKAQQYHLLLKREIQQLNSRVRSRTSHQDPITDISSHSSS